MVPTVGSRVIVSQSVSLVATACLILPLSQIAWPTNSQGFEALVEAIHEDGSIDVAYPVLIEGRISHEKRIPNDRIVSILTSEDDPMLQYWSGTAVDEDEIPDAVKSPDCKGTHGEALTGPQSKKQKTEDRESNKKGVDRQRIPLMQSLMRVSIIE